MVNILLIFNLEKPNQYNPQNFLSEVNRNKFGNSSTSPLPIPSVFEKMFNGNSGKGKN